MASWTATRWSSAWSCPAATSVLLDLKAKLGQPEFAEIPTLSLPRTDGREVYWYNGAHLDLEEIKTLLAESGTANEKEE